MKNTKRILLAAVAALLLVAVSVGGTLAWLADTTVQIQNTFTVGNINIELAETTTNYKMVPGNTIAKNPTVTVKENSEACWLFVKVIESDNLNTYIQYSIAEGWTELETGVYYREVAATTTDTQFSVLAGDAVTVKDVTKAQMDSLTDSTLPTLTFQAYAVQKDNVTNVSTAWEYVKDLTAKTPTT